MVTRIATFLTTIALLTAAVPARADEPDLPRGMEIQARGPIHEAFADPAFANPVAGPIAPKKPPETIAEVAPVQKPEGDNVQWIPGYWTWDQERNDFLWVSGVWRRTPEGRQWVPGYWSEVDDGWQWARGFWAPTDRAELPYQPAPPASLDNGPAAPAPDQSSTYVPGTWMYQSNRYAWQPGYWQEPRSGYVWMPTRYIWTPRGYVCLAGYWDYPLEDRGLLFAPVAFSQPLWTNPGWSYQPSYGIDPSALLDSLFVNPACGSYFYGDYYGAPYLSAGYQPWYAWGPRFYDPLFGYYRWRNRGSPGWHAGLRDGYRARFEGRSARPPRTLALQSARIRNATSVNNNTLRMVKPLHELGGANLRLTRVSAERARVNAQQIQALRQSSVSRAQVDSAARRTSVRIQPRSTPVPHTTTPLPHAAPHGAPLQHGAPHTAHAAPVPHATTPRVAPVQHAAPHPAQHAAPRPVQYATPRPAQHAAPHPAPVHHAAAHAARAAPQARPAPAHAAPAPASGKKRR